MDVAVLAAVALPSKPCIQLSRTETCAQAIDENVRGMALDTAAAPGELLAEVLIGEGSVGDVHWLGVARSNVPMHVRIGPTVEPRRIRVLRLGGSAFSDRYAQLRKQDRLTIDAPSASSSAHSVSR